MSSTDAPKSLSLSALPIDLIGEILHRLPVKLLLQLRCRILLHTYDDYNQIILRTYPLRSLFNDGKAISELNHPLPDPDHRLDSIVSSCDGIICFLVANIFVLWNPTISKFRTLPPPPNSTPYDIVSNFGYLGLVYGFGYDSFSHTYKVVVLHSFPGRQTQAYVFCVGHRHRHMEDYSRLSFPALQYSCGEIREWFASDGAIVSLDLRNESLGEVPQPDCGGGLINLGLDVLKDCLCLHALFPGGCFDVWLMGEFGKKESWSRLLRFNQQQPSSIPFNSIFYISEDGKLLLEYWEDFDVYNPVNATRWRALSFEAHKAYVVYVESLISPCS
ncbi:hypothetical protein Fmac_009294 [Flemingia macrophylla]|uniref:F-box associated beta-propeller type 1 domain-containing protein n=1 Tax=Flemingia macrophylla TaxID=520843 RepID=A0ABD1MZX2_9FABA